MARVRSVSRGTQIIQVHPSEVDCFWQVLYSSDGQKLIHLTTFGSSDRVSPPKSSQSLQLTRAMAEELMKVLRSEYPGL